MLRLPAHEATTAQLCSAYPFAAALPLRCGRVLVGRDLAGGAFLHDPFALYGAGVLTNPNMVVIGRIGRGKSALVKTYLYRQAAFGRQVAVLDPKGEYGPLAEALGTSPIRLSPRGGTRVNPLEASPDGAVPAAAMAERHRRLDLLGTLAEAVLGRALRPVEHLALEIALDTVVARLGSASLPAVVEALLDPGEAVPSGSSRAGLWADGRDVGLQLRRLVHGDLAGMFDGTRSVPVSPGALVVDLSEVYDSDALPLLVLCASAWLQAMCARAGQVTFLVVDEAWAVLSDLAVARFLRSSWKLARAKGTSNVAVCHRVSDLSNSGAAGSEASRLAEGLLADSETLVCYSQPSSEIPALAAWMGCSTEELSMLPTLRRGTALWRVGGQSYLVEHVLGRTERTLVDTDQRFRAVPGAP